MRKQFNHLYEFEPYRLEVQERRLTRAGQAVPLSPKLFDALLLLVENHGRLLEKDELLKTLWPDSFVEESNLTHYISQLRKTLGPDAQGNPYIETVPKRGYRFVARVRQQAEHGGELGAYAFNAAPVGGGVRVEEAELSAPVRALPVLEAPPQTELDWNGWPVEAADTVPLPPAPAPGTPVLGAAAAGRNWRVGIALLVGLAVVWSGVRWWSHAPSAGQWVRAFQQMRPAKLTTNSFVLHAALAPDGKYLVYALREGAQQGLWLKQTTAAPSLPIVPLADVDYRGVSFSPDSTQVYYVIYEQGQRTGTLYQIPALGGLPRPVLHDVDSPVALSPTGQQLCFVRKDPARRQSALILANADGTQERTLAVYSAPRVLAVDGPAWSPDGAWIAVASSERHTGFRLSAVRVADGTEQTLSTGDWPWIGQAAWLPDQRGLVVNAWQAQAAAYTDQLWLFPWPPGEAQLLINDLSRYQGVSLSAQARALLAIQSTRFSRLWIVPGNGAQQMQQASALAAGFGDFYSEAFGLEWLPDDRLVYASNASGNTDLWAVRRDGSQPQQLTRDARVDMAPVTNPAGQVIVYISYQAGRPHLWRMETDGTRARQITAGTGEFDPCLTPDGQWVIYVTVTGAQPQLWKVPAAGGVPELLMQEPATQPRVSPDGQWLACFMRDPQTRQQRLAVLSFARLGEGSAAARFFAQLPAPQWNLWRWTPDSRALTLALLREGVSNLWLQPLDGGPPRQLTAFKEDLIYRFAWSPDGRQLAIERGVTVNEAVLFSAPK
jgi:Tol biopolymer transport system component/DNA-binding winged helix-turn-helix (wHTH) protein